MCNIKRLLFSFYFFSVNSFNNARHPMLTSCQVASKSPVYHGSATSPLCPACASSSEHFPSGSPPQMRAHVAQVHPVHSDQVTKLLIILAGHLPGRMSIAADAMLRQFASDRWIHRVAQFFPAGCCGSNHELIFPPRLSHQVFHHILCHRATADIAVAYE